MTPLGYKVTALAVTYDGTVDLGRAPIDADAFDVRVTLSRPGADPLVGERTVVDAYTNDRPAVASAQAPGRHVILELDEDDSLAPGTWNDGLFTNFYDLTGAYSVTQVEDLVGENGTVPAGAAAVVSSGVLNPVVDDYASGTLAAASGVTLPYRLFSPDVVAGQTYPLVVTLHGHGESGTDNLAQIAGNQISVAFADPAAQERHPAFVLSPQAARANPGAGGWWGASWQAAVVELVERTIAENPAIDPGRVYLAGLSMGSYGSWAMLPQHTDLFTAAILTCGGGDEATAVAALGDFPIWALHSVDDFIVRYDAPGSDYRIFRALESAGSPVTWSEWDGTAPAAEQYAYAADARDRAFASGSVHIFTTFPAGQTPLFSHGSWIPAFANTAIVDWLFMQGAQDAVNHNTAEIEVLVNTGDTGALALNVASSWADLGEARLNASLTALEASGPLPAISVADNRPSNPGWSLTATSGDFVDTSDGTAVIDGRHLGLTPSLTSAAPTQQITVGAAARPGVGFTGGALIGSAGAGAGLGTAVFGGVLDLKAPTNVPGGLTLRSVIDITLL